MVTISTNQRFAECHDPELVELVRIGDDAAFGELVRRHRSQCIRLAYSYVRNHTEAEDHVQNACLKAYERFYQYSGGAEFAVWLKAIVTHECLMSFRTARRVRFLYFDNSFPKEGWNPVQLPSTAPNPEHELDSSQIARAVRNEIGQMPPFFRNVLVLRYIEGVDFEDLAGHLGISVSATKSRLVRARKELRARMLRHL